jgi:hypothetical protein
MVALLRSLCAYRVLIHSRTRPAAAGSRNAIWPRQLVQFTSLSERVVARFYISHRATRYTSAVLVQTLLSTST